MNPTRLVPLLLLPAALLAGCASTAPAPAAAEPPARPAVLVDGATGSPVTLGEVARRAADADVVFIGETHGHPTGLATAAALFDEILAIRPESTALGLEFYERDDQVALDDYLGGITDEEAFRAATGKPAERDSHRPMIESAKAAGRPVWAINAPRRYVRLARTQGFESYDRFTDEQAELVAVPESLTEGRYAETFYELMGGMGGHGETSSDGPSEMVVSFFRSQNVWDATMADSVVRALDAGARPVVVVVGRFHTDYFGGLTERTAQRAPGARIVSLSVLDADAPAELGDDAGRADVIVYAGELPREQ